MMSNNGSMICKKVAVSFINKRIFSLCMLPLNVMVGVFLFLLIQYWEVFPALVIAFMIAICIIVIFGDIFGLVNGLHYLAGKRVLLVLGIRIGVVKVQSIQRFSVTFREESYDKFSAVVKLAKQDGGIMKADYSSQFSYRKHKRLAMAVYTISAKQVDRISQKVLCLPNSVLTLVNSKGEIIWQKMNKNVGNA